jgi:hypothetical protein
MKFEWYFLKNKDRFEDDPVYALFDVQYFYNKNVTEYKNKDWTGKIYSAFVLNVTLCRQHFIFTLTYNFKQVPKEKAKRLFRERQRRMHASS